MNITELRRITSEHRKIVEAIDDLLTTAKVTQPEGEAILLHMAGISAGDRQQSIRGEWLFPLEISWAFAAEMGDG